MKRKQYELMKNDLRIELSKLIVDSGKLKTELQEAKVDFEMMCKSISHRQAELLTRAYFLEEKYCKSIDVLDGKPRDEDGEGSSEVAELPRSYSDSIRRLVEDSASTLYNHGIFMGQEYQEMGDVFEKYQANWKQNVKELKDRIEGIEKQRGKLDRKLTMFNQYVISDDDGGEDDHEEEEDEVNEEEENDEDEEDGSE